MTSYQRDREWEQSEWWRVPLLTCLFPVLIGMMVLDNYLRNSQMLGHW